MKGRRLIQIIIVAFVLAQCSLGWAFYRVVEARGETVEGLPHDTTTALGNSQQLEETCPSDEIEEARREAKREFEQITGQLPERVTTGEMVEQLEHATSTTGCELLSVTMGDVQECCALAVISLQMSIIAPDTPTLLGFVQYVEDGKLNMFVELSQLAFFSEHRTVTLSVQVLSLSGTETP